VAGRKDCRAAHDSVLVRTADPPDCDRRTLIAVEDSCDY